MRRYNIEGHPRNFKLIYEALQGYNQPLRDAFIELGPDKSQAKLNELTARFHPEEIEADDFASSSIDTVGGEVETLLETINIERDALKKYQRVLVQARQSVDSADGASPEQISALMSAVSAATQKKIVVGERVSELIQAQSDRVREVSAQIEKYKEKKYRDPLTGLANLRAFNKMLLDLFEESQSSVAALLKVDSDVLLKEQFGAVFFDKLVRDIAEVVSKEIGDGDFLSYIGNGRFGLIFPHAGLVDARNSSTAGQLNEKLEYAIDKAGEDGGNKSFYLDEAATTNAEDGPLRHDLMMYSEV